MAQIALDQLFEAFSDAETDALAREDLNRLTRLGVASDSGLALLHFKGTEARDSHGSVLAKARLNAAQDSVQDAGRRKF